MRYKVERLATTVLLMLVVACSSYDGHDSGASICSDEWYALVESRVQTGDGLGHGPDLGSEEWRSVVEFKLGIRGDAAVPASDTARWCEYIDNEFIQVQSDSISVE